MENVLLDDKYEHKLIGFDFADYIEHIEISNPIIDAPKKIFDEDENIGTAIDVYSYGIFSTKYL